MLREDQLAGVELNGYLCEQPVGRGGMGVVYRAKDLKLGRTVAIKVLARAFSSDEKQVGRFKREGKAAARLNHPNVATIHNIDDLEGLHYIIMEFLEGRNLEAVVESDGPLDPREAARFVARVAEALHVAHQAKVVHRDIKPANLFLTNAGEIKITDFGLARDYGADDGLTRTGQIVGTPHFMSPEQGEGKQVDARSDIYSLGCSFYFLLTGKKPFEGDSPIAVMVAHIREQPVLPHEINPKVPPAMSQVVLKMMAKTPEERYPTMAEVVRILGRMEESNAAEPEQAKKCAPEPVRPEPARAEPATGRGLGGSRTGRNKGLERARAIQETVQKSTRATPDMEGGDRREGWRSPTRRMGESGPRAGVDRPRTTGPRSGAGGEPSSYHKRKGSREAGPKRMNPLVPIAIVIGFVALALVVVLLMMK
ncbi:MAG: serine/threonine protein kinase [Planctomycetes bacterium]|nr:serine/threonine protein kinase [Planctomycetota bacterium]